MENENNIESTDALAVSPEGLELSAVLAEIDRPAALQSSDGRPDAGDVSVPKVAFCVSDRGSAEWVLRLIAGAEAELALVKDQAAVLIKRLENNVAALHFHFDAQLESWAASEIARQGGRQKSVSTFYVFRPSHAVHRGRSFRARFAFRSCGWCAVFLSPVGVVFRFQLGSIKSDPARQEQRGPQIVSIPAWFD